MKSVPTFATSRGSQDIVILTARCPHGGEVSVTLTTEEYIGWLRNPVTQPLSEDVRSHLGIGVRCPECDSV